MELLPPLTDGAEPPQDGRDKKPLPSVPSVPLW